MADRPDLLIVGGGPAGVSAALWARSRELSAVLLDEGASVGGTLHHVHFAPRDVTGVREVTGVALSAIYAQQLADAGIAARRGVRVERVEPADPAPPGVDPPTALGVAATAGKGVVVTTATGERLGASALLIATGTRRRRLEVPGEREFEDRGVSYSASRDREQLGRRKVAVAGGGDAAYENALILASLNCEVTLIVRGAPRARREFRERVAALATIRVLEDTRVLAIEGSDRVEAVVLLGAHGTTRIAVEAVVIKVGEVPNSDWLGDSVARDAQGFVRVDARMRTSHARIWAAGDIVRPALPSIAVAAGGAALAIADVRAELKDR